MRICFLALILFATTNLLCQTNGDSRVALVIGIKSYTSVAPLKNTLNDARDMAEALRNKGFTVISLFDPKTKREMQEAVINYFEILNQDSKTSGLVYYSGHGMQVDGVNYLIPADANPQIKADLDDQCLNMNYLMRAIEQAGNDLNIFILDACRNNPFRSLYRSSEKGLSMVATPKGSYIVYSTKPGSVASDGLGENGLFTSKLLQHINTTGLSIEEVFKRVARDVANESNDQQRPWIASDYTGDFYFSSSNGLGEVIDQSSGSKTDYPDSNKPKQAAKSEKIADDLPFVAIEINDQTWMDRNLNSDQFSTGVKILEVRSLKQWKQAVKDKKPAYAHFNNDSKLDELYGKLYNRYVIENTKSVCPTGWHIPSETEWKSLLEYVGKDGVAHLKSTDWQYASFGKTISGTNEFKFNAYPSGNHTTLVGSRSTIQTNFASWWSTSVDKKGFLRRAYISANTGGINNSEDRTGIAIRCLKD